MKLTNTRVYSPSGERVAVTEFLTPRAVDAGVLRQMEQEIESYARDNKFVCLIINCGAIREYSSPFLTMLVHLRKLAERLNVPLRVCGMSKTLLKGFKSCKLHEVIPCFDTLDEALGL